MSEIAKMNFLDNPTVYEGTYLEFLGFKLTTWKEGFARLEMPVRPDHRNTVGYLHGGVISSLLDVAGAVAGSHRTSREMVSITINLNVNIKHEILVKVDKELDDLFGEDSDLF